MVSLLLTQFCLGCYDLSDSFKFIPKERNEFTK